MDGLSTCRKWTAIFHTKGHCCDIGGPYCGGLDCLMLHHTMMGEQKLCGVGHCLKADGLGWRTEGQILAIFPDLMRNFCPNRLKISQCQLEGKNDHLLMSLV